MITKFELFEKLDLSDIDIKISMDNNLLNKLIDDLSLIIFKNTKNKKSLRIKSINGNYESNDASNKHTEINITMSNKDTIKGKYTNFDNSIKIYINDDLIYDVDYQKYNSETLLDKIPDIYKKHLKKNKWKIK